MRLGRVVVGEKVNVAIDGCAGALLEWFHDSATALPLCVGCYQLRETYQPTRNLHFGTENAAQIGAG